MASPADRSRANASGHWTTNLAELRERAGLRQLDMAVKAELSLSAYQNYEHGHRLPRLDVAQDLARILGVELSELVFAPKMKSVGNAK